jgi:hypothetical protein
MTESTVATSRVGPGPVSRLRVPRGHLFDRGHRVVSRRSSGETRSRAGREASSGRRGNLLRMDSSASQSLKLTPTPVHEAGHAVVGYALGRRVTLIRIGREAVPSDHPHAEVLRGAVTGGETRFEPALGAEISRRANSGEALDDHEIKWLRAELVTCFAGIFAELKVFGAFEEGGAAADAQQAAIALRFLGLTTDADGGAARLEHAQVLGQTIIDDLHSGLQHVAAQLSAGPCELDEPQAQALFSDAGIECGTHEHLLDQLDA